MPCECSATMAFWVKPVLNLEPHSKQHFRESRLGCSGFWGNPTCCTATAEKFVQEFSSLHKAFTAVSFLMSSSAQCKFYSPLWGQLKLGFHLLIVADKSALSLHLEVGLQLVLPASIAVLLPASQRCRTRQGSQTVCAQWAARLVLIIFSSQQKISVCSELAGKGLFEGYWPSSVGRLWILSLRLNKRSLAIFWRNKLLQLALMNHVTMEMNLLHVEG